MFIEIFSLLVTALAKSGPKDPSINPWASTVAPDWAAFGGISAGFLGFGFLLAIILPMAFARNYPEYSRKESVQLILTLVATGTFCCWFFWACIWLHQANPLIYPERHHFEAEL